MISNSESILNQLLSEDLSGVVFVRDYIQLQFNPNPTINVYAECWVKTDSEEAKFGDLNFANLIIAQIGKDVAAVEENEEFIIIKFKDASRIEIILKSEWVGEAAVMFGRNEEWQSWPH